MQPCFIINPAGTSPHNYVKYIEELKPSRNDLDSEGSGRNILDGLMYRTRIGSKKKWTVTMLRMGSTIAQQLLADLDQTYIDVKMLDPRTNTQTTKTYYVSTVEEGVQRYRGGDTVYDGITFNMTER